jgi:hypothetical protein
VNCLPPLGELDKSSAALANNFIVAHALIQATNIRLHDVFAGQSVTSKSICFESGKAIVDIAMHVHKGQPVHVNPILEASNFLLSS